MLHVAPNWETFLVVVLIVYNARVFLNLPKVSRYRHKFNFLKVVWITKPQIRQPLCGLFCCQLLQLLKQITAKLKFKKKKEKVVLVVWRCFWFVVVSFLCGFFVGFLSLLSSRILHRTFEKQDISSESDIHYQFGQRASEPVLSVNDLWGQVFLYLNILVKP